MRQSQPLFAPIALLIIRCGNASASKVNLCSNVGYLWRNRSCVSIVSDLSIRETFADVRKNVNCNKPHHTLLHSDEMTASANRAKQNQCDGASQTVASVKSVALKPRAGVRLMVAPVRVFIDDGSRFVDTYCFLDNGSQGNICSQRLMDKLHAKGANVHIVFGVSCENLQTMCFRSNYR